MKSQRWRDGRDSYRPPDDERFDPSHHAVALVPGDNDVRPFVSEHHYSGSLPNSGRYRFLIYDTRRPSWGGEDGLVGAAAFGTPSGPSVLKAAFPFLGQPSLEGLELQRLVLLDEVKRNGESWFVSRCMKQIKADGIEAVVSFSDPVQGHVGVVYQALSAWYTGRSKARWSWYLSDGRQINERDLTKIRASCSCCGSGRSASGGDGAVRRLLSWGARVPRCRECRRDWLESVLPEIASRRRHPGNHRYVWGLNRSARKGLVQIHDGGPDAGVYPKQDGRAA